MPRNSLVIVFNLKRRFLADVLVWRAMPFGLALPCIAALDTGIGDRLCESAIACSTCPIISSPSWGEVAASSVSDTLASVRSGAEKERSLLDTIAENC
jgi:hypothetical protein